jgi:hypothetical protein
MDNHLPITKPSQNILKQSINTVQIPMQTILSETIMLYQNSENCNAIDVSSLDMTLKIKM